MAFGLETGPDTVVNIKVIGVGGGGKGNQYSGNVDVGIDGTLPGSGGGGGSSYREADDDDTEGTHRAGYGKAGLCGIMWRYKS